MTQDTREVADILRAQRFELVDARGRVRAVFGPEPGTDTGVGLAVLSPAGERRVSLGVTDDGAWVALQSGGNYLLHLGVNEPESDAVDERAFVYLCDTLGTPLIGWRVTDAGELVVDPSP